MITPDRTGFSGDLFAGHTVFVTGGTSGIGAATAMLFAELGAEVAALGLAPAPRVIGERPDHPRVRVIEHDVRDHDGLARLISAEPRDRCPGQLRGRQPRPQGVRPRPLARGAGREPYRHHGRLPGRTAGSREGGRLRRQRLFHVRLLRQQGSAGVQREQGRRVPTHPVARRGVRPGRHPGERGCAGVRGDTARPGTCSTIRRPPRSCCAHPTGTVRKARGRRRGDRVSVLACRVIHLRGGPARGRGLSLRLSAHGGQNIVLLLAAVSGTSCSAFQCSTILPSRTRKRSTTARPRSPGAST